MWFEEEVEYVYILEEFQKLSELPHCLVECPPHPLFTICHLCIHSDLTQGICMEERTVLLISSEVLHGPSVLDTWNPW